MQQAGNWFLIICSLAGFGLVAGSLALLWCRRITLDGRAVGCQPDGNNEGGGEGARGALASQTPAQPPASELNLWGKIMLKTPYPVLLMFLIGALLIAYPVYGSIKPQHMVTLKGRLGEQGEGAIIQVRALIREHQVGVGEELDIKVPYFENGIYVIKYTSEEGDRLGVDYVSLEPGTDNYQLKGFDTQRAALIARKPIAAKQTEAEDVKVVNQYKTVISESK